nr:uncharacterized protein LOC113402489 isoform X1 [Vanessa tameamea]
MESELSPDNQKKIPPVPIKTYQWEDLKKAREAGGYPWTHLLKAPLEGEITAEDIIRETTPRRSMSREFSKSRTHSPIDKGSQKILNLDSSPGSSRKHSEEGKDEGVHVPNFSKEISLDSEDDNINKVPNTSKEKKTDTQSNINLSTPIEKPISVSPKSILKRRIPEQQYIGITETREKTKCCHPLVNKIKHLADKTLHKLEKVESQKSPGTKRKKNDEVQEIRQLKNSPGAVRRQKFSAIKLGSSDEMTKTMSLDTPPPRKKKEHIYEDIEESKEGSTETSLHFSPEVDNNSTKKVETQNSNNNGNDSIFEKKSNASQDPSLVTEDNTSLKADEYIMEKLHKIDDINKEAILLDEEMDSEEPNVEEVYQNQKDDTRKTNDSPNITITEIYDDDNTIEQSTAIPIESSPSPSPRNNNQKDDESISKDWSTPNSDHEYEIIDKPPPNIIYTAPSIDEKPTMVKTDDELSSTTSLERKYLQHTSDEDEQIDHKDNINTEKTEEFINAETLQKDIEERFFVNTPSTVSRTECEVSTSQVDSSALENLPLKRSSRNKNSDGGDHKIQQRIKEGTGKLKTQAGKLKTKLHNLRNKQFSLPDRPKINFPERPKFKMPERPKLASTEKRKFSLPERPKFKKINISEKLSFGDRKKFSFPDRPKFNVPEMPKFKMPERPKINFPSLGRKKGPKVESNMSESTSDLQNVATVDFEAKTYPRLFNRKKKLQIQKTSSSPTLNREDTPPPTFTFTRVKKANQDDPASYIPDSSEQPREYGTVDNESNYDNDIEGRKQFSRTYDFDKLDQVYMDEEENQQNLNETRNANSTTDISPSNLEYTHINELNNDEFFVRPRGISRENIQVREYLSDEIRQAFNIPKNVLAVMGSNKEMDSQNIYVNEPDEDPELMNGYKEPITYSTEDLNDRDDGYYTFPPVRPSRAKRKKRETESIHYIDDSVTASMQFSEIDLGISEDQMNGKPINGTISCSNTDLNDSINDLEIRPQTDLHSIHEYANDDVIEYPESIPIQSKTLPMPPKRKRKSIKKDLKHSSLNDFTPPEIWHLPKEPAEDIIVYRTEHEYVIPKPENNEQSPLPPGRNRSRSSRATSLCDDDRTSHGAESLILDTHIVTADEVETGSNIRQESPGYATVDKGNYTPSKMVRRSKSKTPPNRQRKSHSAERKYYTVSAKKSEMPSRPPRKKSSTSLMTLNSYTKDSMNGDLTQYDEIDEPRFEELHKDLQSGAVVSKMKDRPLPPPPRPPRGPKRKKMSDDMEEQLQKSDRKSASTPENLQQKSETQDIVEIEVSTQTDPLPDDIDYELGMDENLDISMSSSLRDIIDEESILGKVHDKMSESHRTSRPVSRSEKSFKLSDPKIHSELPKTNLGRTSPTVILVEKRVSSPTRINERDEILTQASLTVQPIDIEESLIPDVPPLPKGRNIQTRSSKKVTAPESDHALERVSDTNRDVQLDNLVTQRLQVRDLDVGRLNVSELQATKILVSDIEGMTLNVNEMDSKSGHISVSGIEFSQTVIDEIVKKFAEISTNVIPPVISQTQDTTDTIRPVSREEETQTDNALPVKSEETTSISVEQKQTTEQLSTLPRPETAEETSAPPQRPPPPDLTPLLYSYLQDIAIPTSSLHPRSYSHRERHLSEIHDQHQTPPPPVRRSKRKPTVQHSESSSEEGKPRPSPRRLPPPTRIHEPTITEAGAQFLRVCQTSISRTFRNIFNTFMTYINRTEDKRDVQMAMVIFLVLIAGLIMFGLSDSRTIHHHHWEFFNPPDGKQ